MIKPIPETMLVEDSTGTFEAFWTFYSPDILRDKINELVEEVNLLRQSVTAAQSLGDQK